MKIPLVSCFLIVFFLMFARYSIAQRFDYPTAKLSTTWTNNESAPHSIHFTDGSTIRAILLNSRSYGPRFACGFYCKGTCDSYLFAVFIVQTNSGGGITQPASGFPQVVWSANPAHPVKLGAKLSLNVHGDLVLRDADGSRVWSTNTVGKHVAGMLITDTGNLVLFDSGNKIVWQSFDHPTDSLVPRQKLFEGQKLIASVSSTNSRNGLYSVEVTNKGLFGYIESKPRRVYYKYLVKGPDRSKERSYVRLFNGSLALFIHSAEPSRTTTQISISHGTFATEKIETETRTSDLNEEPVFAYNNQQLNLNKEYFVYDSHSNPPWVDESGTSDPYEVHQPQPYFQASFQFLEYPYEGHQSQPDGEPSFQFPEHHCSPPLLPKSQPLEIHCTVY